MAGKLPVFRGMAQSVGMALGCWDGAGMLGCWDAGMALGCWDVGMVLGCWDGAGMALGRLGRRLTPRLTPSFEPNAPSFPPASGARLWVALRML